ncbi:antitoxin MazE-like protein [Aurantimonas sp. HBX-1]|uniref:antitoxin MazE-like protein n=1 Tax=Aurantimonas sp. HBX-1 TaxID=2906072 RepID=UPI001F16A80E|nr:antitoxin MazE-like protein [Aurantimonas sp. HBX-1]UIJ72840.1 antitoxin MazE family protein [Aurantimonas sp. HBX-1]
MSDAERAELLAKGWRPVEVWVPDWDSPAFERRMREDSEAINRVDSRSGELDRLAEEVDDLWIDPAP